MSKAVDTTNSQKEASIRRCWPDILALSADFAIFVSMTCSQSVPTNIHPRSLWVNSNTLWCLALSDGCAKIRMAISSSIVIPETKLSAGRVRDAPGDAKRQRHVDTRYQIAPEIAQPE